MKKDFLVCVDSDGCAMDTMNIKHIRAFGPCLVREWELQTWERSILDRWNQINLYSMSRGVNRFKGLAIALSEIHDRYRKIGDLERLSEWVATSDELSNASLKREIENRPSVCLEKALRWSESVNAAIRQLPPTHPFPLVESALRYAYGHADMVVVSGADRRSVEEEWTRGGLLDYVDEVMAQDSGSKHSCIAMLLDRGYVSERVLMCGDAPGDLRAARETGVCFYPILAGREEESWREWIDFGFARFLSGNYRDYEQEKIRIFYENLGE